MLGDSNEVKMCNLKDKGRVSRCMRFEVTSHKEVAQQIAQGECAGRVHKAIA